MCKPKNRISTCWNCMYFLFPYLYLQGGGLGGGGLGGGGLGGGAVE